MMAIGDTQRLYDLHTAEKTAEEIAAVMQLPLDQVTLLLSVKESLETIVWVNQIIQFIEHREALPEPPPMDEELAAETTVK